MEGKKRAGKKDFQPWDILVELLEVCINVVLYVRNIYPDGIFQRQRKYNIGVMMSQHPDVNVYIKDVLETIRPYMMKGEVEKLVIQITKDETPLERFCFEMKMLMKDPDECFIDLESHLRAILLKINTCDAMLKPLPSDCTFQILAYTKMSTLQNMEGKANFQDFPWVIVENQSNLDDSLIIPIRSCNTDALVVQCYVEENQNKYNNRHLIPL